MSDKPKEISVADIKKILPSMEDLLAAGAHFGHQIRRWNPKMAPFVFKKQNKIHIIDLAQTYEKLAEACLFLAASSQEGKRIVLVGTKRQASQLVERVASAAELPYVSQRWLGGFLTNYKIVSRLFKTLNDLESDLSSGKFSEYTKLEQLKVEREIARLKQKVGGVRYLEGMPEVLVLIDTRRERTAVREARQAGVKTVALVDTNCDPSQVDYPVPGNDDAIRAIEVIVRTLASAILLGRGKTVAEIKKLFAAEITSAEKKEAKPSRPSKVSALPEKPSGSLEALGLSARPRNALIKAGYDTVEKIKGLSKEELSAIKGMGAKSVEEVIQKVKN